MYVLINRTLWATYFFTHHQVAVLPPSLRRQISYLKGAWHWDIRHITGWISPRWGAVSTSKFSLPRQCSGSWPCSQVARPRSSSQLSGGDARAQMSPHSQEAMLRKHLTHPSFPALWVQMDLRLFFSRLQISTCSQVLGLGTPVLQLQDGIREGETYFVWKSTDLGEKHWEVKSPQRPGAY